MIEQRVAKDAQDNWTCLCGNVAEDSGFQPCDREGREVEPTEAEWPEALYVCGGCGRIIQQADDNSGTVVGLAATCGSCSKAEHDGSEDHTFRFGAANDLGWIEEAPCEICGATPPGHDDGCMVAPELTPEQQVDYIAEQLAYADGENVGKHTDIERWRDQARAVLAERKGQR